MNARTRQIVYNKCNGHCAYCGCVVTSSDMTIDHVIPQSCGGDDNIANLLPSCKSCNGDKGRYSLDTYRLIIAYRQLDADGGDTHFRNVLKAADETKFYYETVKAVALPTKKVKTKPKTQKETPSAVVTEKIRKVVASSGGKLNRANLVQNLCNPNNPFYIGKEHSLILKHNKQVVNALF